MAESIAGDVQGCPPTNRVPLESLSGLTLQQLLSPRWLSGQMYPASLAAPHVQTVESSQPTSASRPWLSPLDTLIPVDTSRLDTSNRLVHHSTAAPSKSSLEASQPSDFVLMPRSSLQEMQAIANRVTRLEQTSFDGRHDMQPPMRAHTPFNNHYPYPVAGPVVNPTPAAGNVPYWAIALEQRMTCLEWNVDARREHPVRRVDNALPTHAIQNTNGWEASAQNMANQRREDLEVLNATLTNMTTVIMANANERSESILRETKAVSERLKRLEGTLGSVDETSGERTLKERMHSMECMLMELLEKVDGTREAAACPQVPRREIATMTEAADRGGPPKDAGVQVTTPSKGAVRVRVNHALTVEEYSALRFLHPSARIRKWIETMFEREPASAMALSTCLNLYQSAFDAVNEHDILSEIHNVFPDTPKVVYINGHYLLTGISRKQDVVESIVYGEHTQSRFVNTETQTQEAQSLPITYAHASVTTQPTPCSADVNIQVDPPPPGQYADAHVETDSEVQTDPERLGSVCAPTEPVAGESSTVASQTDNHSPVQPYRIQLSYHSTVPRPPLPIPPPDTSPEVPVPQSPPASEISVNSHQTQAVARLPTPDWVLIPNQIPPTPTRGSEDPGRDASLFKPLERELSELTELTPSREPTPDESGADITAPADHHGVQDILRLYHSIPVGHQSDESEIVPAGESTPNQEAELDTADARRSTIGPRQDVEDLPNPDFQPEAPDDDFDLSRDATLVPRSSEAPQICSPPRTPPPADENKNRSPSIPSPATPEAAPSTVSEPTQTQPDPAANRPGIKYIARSDFCLRCRNDPEVDHCEFLPGKRPCTRCQAKRVACGLYSHQSEAEKSEWAENHATKASRGSKGVTKSKTKPTSDVQAPSEDPTAAPAPKVEPSAFDLFSDDHNSLVEQETTVESSPPRSCPPASDRSSVSSLTSLSDLDDDLEPPSDTGPESEEETMYGGSLTAPVFAERSSATLRGSSPGPYEFLSTSDGKRKRRVSEKASEPKKKRKLNKSKAVSAGVAKPVKLKWEHMVSQFALCWVVMSGYNGNCDWPAVISEGRSVTDFVQCSCCTAWYHFGCVGVADESDPRLEATAEFFCPPCLTSIEKHGVGRKLRNIPDDRCARPRCDLHQSDEYFIEKIVGRTPRETANGLDFMWLVMWHGYPIEEATWEPSEKLPVHRGNLVLEFQQAARVQGLPADEDDSYIVLKEAKYWWRCGWPVPIE